MTFSGPLVLLHAFPVDNRLWEDVVPGLRIEGFDPIAPDLRGFGANRDELPTEPTLDALADDIATLIQDQGTGPAVVAGVSLGGYVAMNLARRYPKLVAGLAFIDTKASQDPEAVIEGRLAFADRVEAEGNAWVGEAMMPALISDSVIANKPDVERRIREQIANCPPATIAWVQRAMAKRSASFDVIDEFAGPILVVVGSEDVLSPPAEAVAMAEAARQATLVEIPDVRHLTPLESPAIVTVALADWLRYAFGESDRDANAEA